MEKQLEALVARILLKLKHMEKVLLEKIKLLGNSCKQAFIQTKDVVNHLSEKESELNNDFSEYNGTLPDPWLGC